MRTVTEYSITELENLVDNHRSAGATDRPIFAEALRELEQRRRGFDFHKSIALILAAAREGRFLCCKDLAEASGVNWNRGFRQISAHLGALDRYGDLRYGLLLSTIVVNKQHLATGRVEPSYLKAFIGYAKELGCTVGDAETFLRAQTGPGICLGKNPPERNRGRSPDRSARRCLTMVSSLPPEEPNTCVLQPWH
jgi:hypothetical protein